jgi:hypothetical protein
MLGAIQIGLAGDLPLDGADDALAVVRMQALRPSSETALKRRPLVAVFAQ